MTIGTIFRSLIALMMLITLIRVLIAMPRKEIAARMAENPGLSAIAAILLIFALMIGVLAIANSG
ncbi:hypothetical protein [Acidiphilium acidophilum]|uniref:hypothetical protein n=1 Tax=Acidiphilium acidophilum TaxID=76588 RepID=UPI002E8E6E11|nr:hypothetical protein [Acidiphilium acidophilum]